MAEPDPTLSTPAPPAPDPSLGAEWTSQIPADLAKEPLWKDYSTKPLPDILRTFAEQKKYIGGAIRLPAKDAKPEEIEAWKKDNLPKLAGVLPGAPASPDAYAITRPETAADLGWDDAAEGEFKTLAHGLGLSQQQVEQIVGWYGNTFGGALVKSIGEQNQKATATLQERWGRDFEPFLGRAERFVSAHFSETTREALKSSGIARDADFIQDMYALATQHVEAGLMTGVPAVTLDATTFQTQVAAIRAQMDKVNPGSPQYAELEQQYADLYARQYGSRAA